MDVVLHQTLLGTGVFGKARRHKAPPLWGIGKRAPFSISIFPHPLLLLKELPLCFCCI